MYERNAIVLERYFNEMFGYNMKNNIKTNFKDYSELVKNLELYKNISEEEEKIIQEYDAIANKIREKQKVQESLNKKNNKLQEEINNIFQNIDENTYTTQKKIENLCSNIQNINEDIKENAQEFVEIVAEFSEKSAIRNECGKNRRNIENDYNKKLNETLDDYQDIDINIVKKAKEFSGIDTEKLEKELKERMIKNGEKEKIPFNAKVMTKAITLSVDIQKRETDILANIYEKTNKLFVEIKNNTTKIDKHNKIIKDSKSKLEFISAIKEYLIQFLDNERLTAVNGEEEHNKLMEEACKNLDEDLLQINNLYTLLIKEISKKITKKSYTELYNLNYIKELEKKAEEFDKEIKKLNLPVTIINPNYWRIEGMKKIYDVFYKCVTEYYERDLSEFMPKDVIQEEADDIEEDWEYNKINEQEEKIQEDVKEKNKKNSTKSEIDKKIDMILGFDDEEDEDWEEDPEDWEEDDELEEDDDWEEDDDYTDEDEEDDDEYGEEDDDEDDEEIIEEWNDELDDDDDDVEYEVDGEEIKPVNKQRNKKEDSWENEFINTGKKDKPKKKRSFFDKFKK